MNFRDYLRKVVIENMKVEVWCNNDKKVYRCPKPFKIKMVAEDYIELEYSPASNIGIVTVDVIPISAITRIITKDS